MENGAPLIVLKGLEGNPPASLTLLQSKMLPYEQYIEVLWWSLWLATLAFVVVQYLILPLIQKMRGQGDL